MARIEGPGTKDRPGVQVGGSAHDQAGDVRRGRLSAAGDCQSQLRDRAWLVDYQAGEYRALAPGPQESFECRLVVYDRPGEEPLTSVVEHFGGMFFLAGV